METTDFFSSLLDEIRINKNLQGYYRFLQSEKLFEFRKTYYLQRLNYINSHITKPNAKIWDVGCGYGTTGIFLALNGHSVYGNTLEYYFEEIPNRIKHWSQKGDLSRLKLDYANLFDAPPEEKFDYIIVQDTLHHLEPVNQAIKILHDCLNPDGEIIVLEENGKNLIQRIKLFKQRGNKKVIEIYDEKLGKSILLGNENIRRITKWKQLFAQNELQIQPESISYNRFFFPGYYKGKNSEQVINREYSLSKIKLIRDFFFFGLSFIARRTE